MSINLPLDTDTPHISFVVPFFASHHRLDNCLDSIHRHVSIPYEIILIDDGNTDYDFSDIEHKEEVRLIRQENAGPGAARNAGVYAATGHYIQFIDSDDELVGDVARYFHQASKLVSDKNVDMVVGVLEGDTINKELANELPTHTRVSDNLALIKMASFTAHLYRRAFLVENAITFPTDTLSAEDTVFLVQAIAKAEDIILTDVAIYRYVKDHSSISRKPFDWESYRMRFGIATGHMLTALEPFEAARHAKVSQIFKYGITTAKKNLQHGFAVHQPDATDLLRTMVLKADLRSKAAVAARKAAFIYWDDTFDQCMNLLVDGDTEGFFQFIERTPIRVFKHQQAI